MCVLCVLVTQLCPTLCDPMGCTPKAPLVHGIFQLRVLHFLLQGIFPTQGSNLGLLHCRQILYQLNYKGRANTECYGNTMRGVIHFVGDNGEKNDR